MSGPDVELLNYIIIGSAIAATGIGLLIYKFLIKPRRKVQVGTTFAAPPKEGKKTPADDAAPGTLPAYVWREDGIKPELIKDPIGTLWFADPSLPVSGNCYLCTEDAQGKLVAYDPRVSGIETDNAPQDLFEAILCPEVLDFYSSETGLWDKIKTLIPYIIAAGLLLIALAMSDKF